MQRIRWKSRYASGDPDVDRQARALVEGLNDFITEMTRLEHCRDITELHTRLGAAVADTLSQAAGQDGTEVLANLHKQVNEIIAEGLPLPAKGTPACTNCGLCNLIDERMTDWLKNSTPRSTIQVTHKPGSPPAPKTHR